MSERDLIVCVTAPLDHLGNVVCECTVHAKRAHCGDLSELIRLQIFHCFLSYSFCFSKGSLVPHGNHPAERQSWKQENLLSDSKQSQSRMSFTLKINISLQQLDVWLLTLFAVSCMALIGHWLHAVFVTVPVFLGALAAAPPDLYL